MPDSIHAGEVLAGALPPRRPARRERGRPLLARPRRGPAPARRRPPHLRATTRAPRACSRPPAASAPHSTAACCASWTPSEPTTSATSSTSGARAPRSTVLANEGPLPPRRAAWMVTEVADSLARPRGRARPRPAGPRERPDRPPRAGPHHRLRRRRRPCTACRRGGARADLVDLAGLLYAALTGKWAGRLDPRCSPTPPPSTAPCCARGRSAPASPGPSTRCATRSSTPAGPARRRSPPR